MFPMSTEGRAFLSVRWRADFAMHAMKLFQMTRTGGGSSKRCTASPEEGGCLQSVRGFITTVREKLHLGQKEAEELFGGGINSFSRYETGEAKPPLSLVKLFCILNRHPELLIEVRSGCPTLPEE